MLFSVVIPCFNRLSYLPQALSSVWSQTFTDYEVIVVDDGSTDGTAAFLESQHGRLRVVRQDHRGPGASRNAGAASATGEYLAFLDSDDLWFPWTLDVFRTLIARHQRPALLCSNYQQFAAVSELSGVREDPALGEFFPDYLASWHHHRAVGAGMLVVHRPAFETVGGFTTESSNLEDHDLALRLGEARGFVQITTLTLAYRRHVGGTTNEMAKNVAGCQRLLGAERAREYPGGPGRAAARRQIITQHARSTSLECGRAGLLAEAWLIYRATLRWHAALGRWKYILTFPPYLAFAAVSRLMRRPPPESLR